MKKILLYIFIAILLVPFATKAQDTYTLLEPLPCIEGTGNNCVTDEKGMRVVEDMSLETYIGYVFKFAIAISAFLAVIMIIYGGFEIMLSEAIPAKLDGKERIKNAIFGLLMVLSSYLILQTIDPRLVEINTSLKPITIDVSEVTNYQKQFATSLDNLSKESQFNVSELTKQNVTNQEKIDLLNYKNSSEAGLSDDELVELEKLKQSVGKNNAEIVKEGATAETTKIFLDTINNPDAIYLTYKNAQGSIDSITLSKINELRKLGDNEGAQKLQDRQKFFSEQIDKQGLINGSITQYNAYDLRTKLYEAQQQNEKIQSENGPFTEDIMKIKADPILLPLYKTILNSRITRIEAALNKK